LVNGGWQMFGHKLKRGIDGKPEVLSQLLNLFVSKH
jgi:hypothetical protein